MKERCLSGRWTGFTHCLVFAALWGICGCDAPIDRYPPNELYALTLAKSRDTETVAAMVDTDAVIDRLFGTPDRPHWPVEWIADDALAGLVDAEAIVRVAGAVSSDRQGLDSGLFRKHCVDCHGLTGDGSGPASLMQNPYPRDFRHGIFKWKSTVREAKPTRDDLRELLLQGVPGTAMPTFRLLSEPDREALVDFVIYLTVRGEVERRLMAAAIDELGYEEAPPEEPWRLRGEDVPESETGQLVQEILVDVMARWVRASEQVVAVPAPGSRAEAELAASISRGQAIFHGPIANCAGCHGPAGNGQSVTVDFDDWTKEYSTRLGIIPTDREALRPFRSAGGLKPRQIHPRPLQQGVFRGGDSPASIYRRIVVGIAGTPMPGIEVVNEENGKGLTSDQIWDLVRYVVSLSNEAS